MFGMPSTLSLLQLVIGQYFEYCCVFHPTNLDKNKNQVHDFNCHANLGMKSIPEDVHSDKELKSLMLHCYGEVSMAVFTVTPCTLIRHCIN